MISPLEARVWCALMTEDACSGRPEGQLVISDYRITLLNIILEAWTGHADWCLCLHFVPSFCNTPACYCFQISLFCTVKHAEGIVVVLMCRGYCHGADEHAHGDLVILTSVPSLIPRTSYFGLGLLCKCDL